MASQRRNQSFHFLHMESEESIINLEHEHHSQPCLLSALENKVPWIHREKEWLDIGWGLKAICQEGELRTSIPESGSSASPRTGKPETVWGWLAGMSQVTWPEVGGIAFSELGGWSWASCQETLLDRYQTEFLSITCAWILRGPEMDATYVLHIFSKTFHRL